MDGIIFFSSVIFLFPNLTLFLLCHRKMQNNTDDTSEITLWQPSFFLLPLSFFFPVADHHRYQQAPIFRYEKLLQNHCLTMAFKKTTNNRFRTHVTKNPIQIKLFYFIFHDIRFKKKIQIQIEINFYFFLNQTKREPLLNPSPKENAR